VSDLPVACSFMPAELQERRRSVFSKIRGAVSEVTELKDGFRYQFASDGELITELANLILLEHQCCPSSHFASRWNRATVQSCST